MTKTELEATKTELEALGYFPVKQLPNGKWAGVMDMAYTTGLFCRVG